MCTYTYVHACMMHAYMWMCGLCMCVCMIICMYACINIYSSARCVCACAHKWFSAVSVCTPNQSAVSGSGAESLVQRRIFSLKIHASHIRWRASGVSCGVLKKMGAVDVTRRALLPAPSRLFTHSNRCILGPRGSGRSSASMCPQKYPGRRGIPSAQRA